MSFNKQFIYLLSINFIIFFNYAVEKISFSDQISLMAKNCGIKKLAEFSSNPNFLARKNENNETILIIAVKEGNVDFVKALLQFDIIRKSINAKAKNNWTALDWAVLIESFDIVKILIDAGCIIDQTSYELAKVLEDSKANHEIFSLLSKKPNAIEEKKT